LFFVAGVLHCAAALLAAALLAVGLAAGAPADAATSLKQPPRFYAGSPDAAAFRAECDAHMKAAQAALDRLVAVKG
jgi:hypothetical protein